MNASLSLKIHAPAPAIFTNGLSMRNQLVSSASDFNTSDLKLKGFKVGGTPIFPLRKGQSGFISMIFKKMLSEQSAGYIFKDELIRNYINLIIHEGLKLQPSDNYFKQQNAPSRITALFLDLLERQF